MATIDNNVIVGQNQNITNDTRANAAAFISQNFPVSSSDPAANLVITTNTPAATLAQTQQSVLTAITGSANPTPTAQAQTNADNGADPYVSNGQSTITPTPASQLTPVVSDTTSSTQAVSTVTPVTATVDNTYAPPSVVTDQQNKTNSEFAASQSNSETQRLEKQNTPGNNTPTSATSVNAAQGGSKVLQQKSVRAADDWRVRLSLAPSSNYFYNDPNIKVTDLLYPLRATGGVIFPYTPNITVGYRANYDTTELIHSNYKSHAYKGSSVDEVQITCEFTAQDTQEANYLLAVIHFFKSVTKMFYGQDPISADQPRGGTPPPLCYLTGLGQFQFDNHPLAITSFNLNLPNEVDYIRAGSSNTWSGQTITASSVASKPALSGSIIDAIKSRLKNNGITKAKPVDLTSTVAALANEKATYVPTKMQIQITALPIISRNDISNTFSLGKYATGELLKGSTRNGGGIW